VKAPPPLAREHVFVQRLQVPALGQLGTQRRHERSERRLLCKVVQLLRIARKVVELVRIHGRMDELVVAASHHHHRRDGAFGQVLANRKSLTAFSKLTMQLRHEARTVDGIGPFLARLARSQFDERGQQIEVRNRCRHTMRRKTLRRMHDQRHAHAAFEARHLVPEPALAEHFAVIRRDDDDRVVGEPGCAERIENRAELRIDIRQRAVIRMPRIANLLFRRRRQIGLIDIAKAFRMRIALFARQRHARHVDLFVTIQVPVLLRNRIGIMRMRERRDHAEGPHIAARLALAHDVIQLLARGVRHFVVEIELVRAHARARIEHRAHVVIPARPHIRVFPIGHPAEIGGIDIRRQPLFETMQLIGAAEMHLAGKNRPVARCTQIVRERQRLRGQFGGVIVSTDCSGQLARHH
jgi:hypothetical protein